MPARDVYHQAVKFAPIKDGWTILAEDYVLQYGEDKVYADIAAEQTIAAQKQGRRIIVEVKSFLGRSFINDLEVAVGQYVIYRDILEETNSDFKIYSRLQVHEVQPFGFECNSGTLKGAAIAFEGVPHAPAKRYI
ncbi:element excision factor XisH family protein [Microseira sp. BLCC-F43]|jgi:hypothetical protein|uniref:element excision factor XisH family protein n=1 Tax=Microseira sp. BLCC-F43 TaxID=3153602 RepID=UPI0035BAD4BB